MVLLPDIDTYYDLLKYGITLNVVYVYLIQGTLVTLLSQGFSPLGSVLPPNNSLIVFLIESYVCHMPVVHSYLLIGSLAKR